MNVYGGNVYIGQVIGSSNYGNAQSGGRLKTERYQTKNGFEGIEIEDSIDVEWTQSEERQIEVTAPEYCFEQVHMYVASNILHVKYRSGGGSGARVRVASSVMRNVAIKGSGDFSASETVKCAEPIRLFVRGSGDISFGRMEADELDIEVQGSGDVSIGDLEAKEVTAKMMGSGDIDLSGRADLARYSMLGSGDIDASGLSVLYGSANCLGTGDISCNVKDLMRSCLGGGEIHNHYYPRTRSDVKQERAASREEDVELITEAKSGTEAKSARKKASAVHVPHAFYPTLDKLVKAGKLDAEYQPTDDNWGRNAIMVMEIYKHHGIKRTKWSVFERLWGHAGLRSNYDGAFNNSSMSGDYHIEIQMIIRK